jgi:hypothetical protein
MQETRRRSAHAWRELVARFAHSGLTEEAFCEGEGIGVKLFHRWRSKRSSVPPRASAYKAAQVSSRPAGFVDLGGIGSGGLRFEVRLELGAGVILSVARG